MTDKQGNIFLPLLLGWGAHYRVYFQYPCWLPKFLGGLVLRGLCLRVAGLLFVVVWLCVGGLLVNCIVVVFVSLFFVWF